MDSYLDAPSEGELTNYLARLFAITLGDALLPLGIAPAQFAVLLLLWKQTGLAQRDLAIQLGVEQATMANTLARMERDGLITRQRHPQDARTQIIQLTAQAKRLRRASVDTAQAINDIALQGVSANDRQTLRKLLLQMTENLRDARQKRS